MSGLVGGIAALAMLVVAVAAVVALCWVFIWASKSVPRLYLLLSTIVVLLLVAVFYAGYTGAFWR